MKQIPYLDNNFQIKYQNRYEKGDLIKATTKTFLPKYLNVGQIYEVIEDYSTGMIKIWAENKEHFSYYFFFEPIGPEYRMYK